MNEDETRPTRLTVVIGACAGILSVLNPQTTFADVPEKYICFQGWNESMGACFAPNGICNDGSVQDNPDDCAWCATADECVFNGECYPWLDTVQWKSSGERLMCVKYNDYIAWVDVDLGDRNRGGPIGQLCSASEYFGETWIGLSASDRFGPNTYPGCCGDDIGEHVLTYPDGSEYCYSSESFNEYQWPTYSYYDDLYNKLFTRSEKTFSFSFKDYDFILEYSTDRSVSPWINKVEINANGTLCDEILWSNTDAQQSRWLGWFSFYCNDVPMQINIKILEHYIPMWYLSEPRHVQMQI